MQRICHSPMLPNSLRKLRRIAGQRRQVIARFHRDMIAHLTARLHHADAVQVGPYGFGAQPCNIGRDPKRPICLCFLCTAMPPYAMTGLLDAA